MGKKQKLIDRLLSKPKDFRWKEVILLLKGAGYEKLEGSGSRVKFYRNSPRDLIIMHKPHPGDIVKDYQVKELICHLTHEK